MHKAAAGALLGFLCVLILLFGLATEYSSALAMNTVRYPYFQDVHVMVFVGFGFLMSFLQHAGFTATSHAYFVAVVTAMWGMLNNGFWGRVIGTTPWARIELNTESLILADFAAATVLISFGAVLGRFSATQLLVMGVLEVVFYSVNEAVLFEVYHVSDIGGSMAIHAFGALFGVMVAFVASTNTEHAAKPTPYNRPTKTTDTLAMVGTLFLFCYWPSFNGALAGELIQDRTVVNTYLSICTSAMATFLVSCLLDEHGRFSMVDIQNATIAGGVAIGTSADMMPHPWGAMLIGAVAGAISTLGYRKVAPALYGKLGMIDTCGILNLHGVPGLLGGLAGLILSSYAEADAYGTTLTTVFAKRSTRTASEQAGFQAAALFTTIGIALVGGAITGAVCRAMPVMDRFYDDSIEYEADDVVEEQPLKATSAVTSAGNVEPFDHE
jgi:ammonium transporter Rh